MLDWLFDSSTPVAPISAIMMAIRLVAACLLGFTVAAAYRLHRYPTPVPATFPLTLVLLSILIAMVMQVIDDRVARAFSLVGALSIVRFRTVLDETQDIAFVIFAVVVGMASGTGAIAVAIIGSIVMIGTLCVSRLGFLSAPKPLVLSDSQDANITLRLAVGTDFDRTVLPVLESSVISFRFVSAETSRGGTVLEWTYSVRLKLDTTVASIVERFCKTEGVQNVKIQMRDNRN